MFRTLSLHMERASTKLHSIGRLSVLQRYRSEEPRKRPKKPNNTNLKAALTGLIAELFSCFKAILPYMINSQTYHI